MNLYLVWSVKVRYLHHKSPPLERIMIQINHAHILTPFYIGFNFGLPSHLRPDFARSLSLTSQLLYLKVCEFLVFTVPVRYHTSPSSAV
jgi:hypothetical protein